MYDKLDLEIPFDELHVNEFTPVDGVRGGCVDFTKYGFKMFAETLFVNGKFVYSDPSVQRWDSIASSISHLAVGFFPSGNGFNPWPHVRLKASPAKLLQGHNVFGSESLKQGALQMIALFQQAFPKIYQNLNLAAAEISYLDATYSAVVESNFYRKTIYRLFGSLADRRILTQNRYDNYLLIGSGSEHKRQKIYSKYQEFMYDLECAKKANDVERIKVLSDKKLQDFALPRMRFEGTIGRREMKRLGIPTLLSDFLNYSDWYESIYNHTVCKRIWDICFKKLFDQVEGHTMKKTDDESIKLRIDAEYIKVRSDGRFCKRRANAVFKTYRDIKHEGYAQLASEDNKTFYRNVNFLIDAGISKAFLKSLDPHKPNENVVPIIELIKVDFSNQRPDWYVEPVANYTDKRNHLKLVS